MRFTQSWLAVGVIVTSMALPNSSWAKSELDLRITRLENIVQNEINVGLLNQLDAMQQEIRELRGKLEEQQNALQAANKKQEKLFMNLDGRVNNLTTAPAETAEPETAARAPASAPVIGTEPELLVVAEPAAAAAPAPEPAAAAIPSPVALQPTTNDASGDMDPTPPATLITEKSLYNSAYSLMSTKKYAEAITEFKDLIWQYPEGSYSASAYYWLGEMYLLQWQDNNVERSLLEQAKESFSVVTSKYQGDPKELDALLKLGMVEIDLGNFAAAKDALNQVIKKQPNSSRARMAAVKLQAIKQ